MVPTDYWRTTRTMIVALVYVLYLFGRKRDFGFRILGYDILHSCYFIFLSFLNIPVNAAVVHLEDSNFESGVNQAEIVFVNFYADWCRFSQMLTPIFEEASNKFPGKNKRNVITFFVAKEGVEWDNIKKIASNLREECSFWVGVGEAFKQQTMGGNNVAFRPPGTDEDQVFSGNLQDFEYMRQWITDKCIPLVREITFENAEELTEEGLPFLILFRDPADSAIVETYNQQVAAELADQKTSVNFLIADGKKFAHPLHHLGKAERDLPVLAIDSFRHMYLFPNMAELTVPGRLKQFVADLHSGKLHREFHHGPDPTEPPLPPAPQEQPGAPAQVPIQMGGQQQEQQKTSPPESVFEKLKPSRNRYTILKDEL